MRLKQEEENPPEAAPPAPYDSTRYVIEDSFEGMGLSK
jgi:hypothetical protein